MGMERSCRHYINEYGNTEPTRKHRASWQHAGSKYANTEQTGSVQEVNPQHISLEAEKIL